MARFLISSMNVKFVVSLFSISTSGNVGYQESSCASKSMSTSCTVNGLTPATTYYFKVQAVHTQDDVGPYSDFAVATTNTSSKLFFFFSCFACLVRLCLEKFSGLLLSLVEADSVRKIIKESLWCQLPFSYF